MSAGEWVGIIAGLTAMLTAIGAFINSAWQARKAARQDEFQRLLATVETLQEENQRLLSRINMMQEQLDRRDQRIQELQAEVDQLRTKLAAYEQTRRRRT